MDLLRNAFSASSGIALDVAAVRAQNRYPAFSPKADWSPGVLKIGRKEVGDAVESIRERGFWVSPHRVSPELLRAFEESAEIKTRSREKVNLERRWVQRSPLARALALDPAAYEIAGRYFGAAPVLSLLASWFSFPNDRVPDLSAQNWHWHCDGIKWLKVFVYVTDEGPNNGPQSYIPGSHRRNVVIRAGEADSLRASRYTDSEVFGSYPRESEVKFEGPRGTVIFEDTRGLHRGTPVVDRHRLILQSVYATDYFGRPPGTRFDFPPETLRQARTNLPRLLMD